MSNITASSKLSLAYDSLREVLEALALKKDYKIYNHDCFSAFLYEILEEKNFAQYFDKFRKVRNKINYYEKKLNIDETRIFLDELVKFKKDLLEKYF